MTETIMFAIFIFGIFISMIIYIVRFLKTPNLFKRIFKAYMAFLERDTVPKIVNAERPKAKKSNNWKFSNESSCFEYEKFKEEFPDEEYPNF